MRPHIILIESELVVADALRAQLRAILPGCSVSLAKDHTAAATIAAERPGCWVLSGSRGVSDMAEALLAGQSEGLAQVMGDLKKLEGIVTRNSKALWGNGNIDESIIHKVRIMQSEQKHYQAAVDLIRTDIRRMVWLLIGGIITVTVGLIGTVFSIALTRGG